MNKLNRHDALKLQTAMQLVQSVQDYNNLPSSPLYQKLKTIINKLNHVLLTETTDAVQQEYHTTKNIKG